MYSKIKKPLVNLAKNFVKSALGYHTAVLDNGVTLNIQSRHGKNFVIEIRFDEGHDADPEGKSVAHLLEHMVGGRFNRAESPVALITRDITRYDFRWRQKEDPEEVFDFCRMIRERLFDTNFDAADIDREKNVVLISESADRERWADWICVFEKTVDNTWTGHALDTEQTLQDVGVQELQDFMERHYVGRKMTIDFKGPINAMQARFALEEIFGNIPPGEKREKEKRYVDYEPGEYVYPDPHMGQLEYTFGFVLPEEFRHKVALQVVLDQYMKLVSWEAFRGKGNQTLYTPETQVRYHDDMLFLLLHGTVLPQHAHKIAPAYAEILSDMAAGKIDPELFEQAREICLLEKIGFWKLKEQDFMDCGPSDLTDMTRGILSDQRISLVKRGVALDSISLKQLKQSLFRDGNAAPDERQSLDI
ncbi:MAG: insulinase family protein [Alphaproteobacteria bacterium]|nr:insulinase family protein [Alphaproteobacteria bacterium]MCD8520108.1 insulinase family protein [Alphaproteobacteria bacterium]MCD8570744.1 insulinase family protein [Alphaproteobacteria bacterium]